MDRQAIPSANQIKQNSSLLHLLANAGYLFLIYVRIAASVPCFPATNPNGKFAVNLILRKV
jgi:hypothetical protein